MTASFGFTKVLTSSLNMTPGDSAVVRNQMSDGYGKQYNRFSANFITTSCEYLMSQAQYTSFLTWWETNKAGFFDWVDPVSGTTYQGRMVEGQFGAAPYSLRATYYSVTMDIERVL